MVINNYLLELISTEEMVCLPDFGGFISKHVSAHLDPSTHIFSPPQKQLAFNERLTDDGGKLIQALQERENISLLQASEKVAAFVAEIKAALLEHNEFKLKGIGYFYIAENGNYNFKPSLDPKIDPLNFGLPQILVKYQPSDYSNKDFLQKPKDRKAMSTLDLQSVPDPGRDGDNPAPTDKKPGKPAKKESSLVWLYIITPIVLLGSLGVFLGGTDDGKKMLASMHVINAAPMEADSNVTAENATEADLDKATSENTTTETPTESFDNAVSAEETIKKTDTETWGEAPVKSQQEDIAKTEDAQLATANLITGKSGRYFVIVGGFSSKKNAVKLREKLIHDGLEAKVIAPDAGGTLYRVSLGDYGDRVEAAQKANALKTEHGNDLWVMEY